MDAHQAPQLIGHVAIQRAAKSVELALLDVDQHMGVDLMEVCYGCGNLTFAAVYRGLQVGPGVYKGIGFGHASSVRIDMLSPHDRITGWAFVARVRPSWIHIGITCTSWVAIAHLGSHT